MRIGFIGLGRMGANMVLPPSMIVSPGGHAVRTE